MATNLWTVWKKLLQTLRSNEVRHVTIVEPWWFPGVAVTTGLLAAISGVIYVRTASLGNEAVYYSNQAVLAQAQASDAWAEYEADSNKAKTVEIGLMLSTDPKVTATLKKQQDDYRKRQAPLKQKAQGYEDNRQTQIAMTNKKIHDRDGLGIAGVVIQLGIGLVSVAAMTKRNSVFIMSIIVTLIGLGITGFAFLHIFFK